MTARRHPARELLRRQLSFLLALHGDHLGHGYMAIGRQACDRSSRGGWHEEVWALPPRERLAELVAKTAALGRAGRNENVYVSALAFSEPRRRNVLALPGRVLWADCDQPEALDRVRRFPAHPHIVVRTGRPGGGLHAYWLLDDELEPDRIGDLNRRLAEHLGADPAACDPARVLRLPYTRNQKHSGAPLVELVLLRDREQRHPLAAITDALPRPRPVPALPRKPVGQRAPVSGRSEAIKAELKSIAPAAYVPELVGEQPDRGGYVRCPFPHPHSSTGRDENPSLKIHDDGWHCYGCGRHGDIIALEAELRGHGPTPKGPAFAEVLEGLAARFGVGAQHDIGDEGTGRRVEQRAPAVAQRPAGLSDRLRRFVPFGSDAALGGDGAGAVARPWLGPAAWAALLAALLTLLLLAMVAMITVLLGDSGDSAGTCAAPATGTAIAQIPARLMPIYTAAAGRYRLGPAGWAWLAAINNVETDFGRNLSVSTAGAVGWMQFMPSTWRRYGVDANRDGRADPEDPEDAIYTAARYLRASGAPGDWSEAVFAYNHAAWYVAKVTALAAAYAAAPATSVQAGAGDQTAAACAAPAPIEGGDPDAHGLLANPNVTLVHPGQRLDLLDGRISPRLIVLLSAIATRHRIAITALASDHAPGTNHEAGRAADIGVVDGERCNALAHGRAGRCYQLARELARMQGCLKPTELIYYWIAYPSRAYYGSATLAEHEDHIHVGFDGPLGAKHYAPGTDPCSTAAIDGTGP